MNHIHRKHCATEAGKSHASAFADWCDAMARGCFNEAWSINDQARQHWPSAHQLWSGESLAGKRVTVCSLHGLGDAVQMLQYAAALEAMGVAAHFEVPEALTPLMPYFTHARIPEGIQDGRSLRIESMELPYLFRTSAGELPLATRYLRLPKSLIEAADRKLGRQERMRVGLVWRGGDWDRARWVPPAWFDALADLRDNEFWNLQEDKTWALPSKLRMRSASDICGSGLLALAATLANLDLLVTVDTLAAHLAGALGVPTLLLLKQNADWRWMSGSTTPWYPTLKLIRQTELNDWGPVISKVGGILEESRKQRCLPVASIPLAAEAALPNAGMLSVSPASGR